MQRNAPTAPSPYLIEREVPSGTIERSNSPPRAAGVTLVEVGNVVDLELPVKPPGKDIYRPPVGVVGGVGDELIVEADFRR